MDDTVLKPKPGARLPFLIHTLLACFTGLAEAARGRGNSSANSLVSGRRPWLSVLLVLLASSILATLGSANR